VAGEHGRWRRAGGQGGVARVHGVDGGPVQQAGAGERGERAGEHGGALVDGGAGREVLRLVNRSARPALPDTTWHLVFRAQVSPCFSCKILQGFPKQALPARLRRPRDVTADPVFPGSAADEL